MKSLTSGQRIQDESWQRLANAIVVQAGRDYKSAQRGIGRIKEQVQTHKEQLTPMQLSRLKASYTCYRRTMAECERFFRSNWFAVIAGADGEIIFHRLKKEAA